MAKKSFIGGLDNLLASAGVKKKIPGEEEKDPKIPENKNKTSSASENDVQLLSERIERLNNELHLWRTDKLSSQLFLSTLKDAGLQYIPETNEIIEL